MRWRRAALALALLLIPLPASAHDDEALELWQAYWSARIEAVNVEAAQVEWVLTPDLTAQYLALYAEWADWESDHPCQLDFYCPPAAPPHRAQAAAPRPSASSTFSPGVEQWRPLVATYFPPNQVEKALQVMACETVPDGNPNSYNSSSGASGLFQHLPKYWAERSANAGWTGADIFDPVANVAVAAWLWSVGGWGHWTCA